MRIIISILVLFVSSIARSDGNDTELLCDNPGAGVTCLCSETFTIDDPPRSGTQSFNPSGSITKQCNTGPSVAMWGNVDSVPASSVANPITVGGSGNVLWMNSQLQLNDTTASFTNATYCARHYAHYGTDWDCPAPNDYNSNTCNQKGPRYMNSVTVGNIWGLGTGTNTPQWYWWPGYNLSNAGTCANSTASGCGGLGAMILRRSSGWTGINNIDLPNMQGGWIRIEVCGDHNLTAAQVVSMNAQYGSALVWPGANHVYSRVRLTFLTGPKAGEWLFYGPSYQQSPISSVTTAEVTRHFDTTFGSAPNGVRGQTWLSYVMAARKTPADPLYWIGAAEEVEGAVEPTPTPTATNTPTATPTSVSTSTPPPPTPDPANPDYGCQDSSYENPAVLWCDNFDDGVPIADKYNDYNGGNASDAAGSNYKLASSVGIGGTSAMRIFFKGGSINPTAGYFSIGIGKMIPFHGPEEDYAAFVAANPGVKTTGNYEWPFIVGNPATKYQELFVRQFIRIGAGWEMPTLGGKFIRLRVLSDPMEDDLGPNPTAYHPVFYQDPIGSNNGIQDNSLKFNSTNGVSSVAPYTEVVDKGNNTQTSPFIAQTGGESAYPIFQDSPSGTGWFCVEAHVKLNSVTDVSAVNSGIEEYWQGAENQFTGLGEIQATRSNQNGRWLYDLYGLNQVVFEAALNGTVGEDDIVFYRDNIVISTERIGCQVGDLAAPAPPTGVLTWLMKKAAPTPAPAWRGK